MYEQGIVTLVQGTGTRTKVLVQGTGTRYWYKVQLHLYKVQVHWYKVSLPLRRHFLQRPCIWRL